MSENTVVYSFFRNASTALLSSVCLLGCGGSGTATEANAVIKADANATSTSDVFAGKTIRTLSGSTGTPNVTGAPSYADSLAHTDANGGLTVADSAGSAADLLARKTPGITGPGSNTASSAITGTKYYVDSAAGNDNNDGRSSTSAWRTINRVAYESERLHGFKAGDGILFRRGQLFQTTGYPTIKVVGTPLAPVVFDTWGSGTLPRFDNNGPGVYELIMKIDGSYAEVHNLSIVKLDPLNVTEMGIRLTGTGHRVADCEFAGVGIGIRVEGSGHRIDHNYFHDLTMIVASSTYPNDDYGANAIVVSSASSITVDHNRFERLRAYSPDYGEDGSVIEVNDSVSNLEFFNNTVSEVNVLTEMGASIPNSRIQNIRFHHNLILNADGIGWFHNDPATSLFAVTLSDVRFEHNTFVKNTLGKNAFFFGFGQPAASGEVSLTNNVLDYVDSKNLFNNTGLMLHRTNLYYLRQAVLGSLRIGSDELAMQPGFRNAAGGDYHLGTGSPALNRGVELGYKLDLDDLQMPVGKPDLGAYESR